MSERQFQCPECHVTSDYYSAPKTLDPRMLPKCRTICQDCADRIGAPASNRYPDVPGSKTGGASAEAAYKMRDKARTLDDALLIYLGSHGPICPDDYAKLVGIEIINSRPIFSRCVKRGHVRKMDLSEAKAKSKYKNSAHLFTITPLGRAVLETFRRAV